MRYFLKGLKSGMVVVRFAEGVWCFHFPNIDELLHLICEIKNIQINFKIAYSFSNPIDDQNV